MKRKYAVKWSRMYDGFHYDICRGVERYCGGFNSYADALEFAVELAKRPDFISCSLVSPEKV